jgi:hypothetical protein
VPFRREQPSNSIAGLLSNSIACRLLLGFFGRRRRFRYPRRRCPYFVGDRRNEGCYVMTVEFDVDTVGTVRILASVLPNNRARFIRVVGKGRPPRFAQQRLDLRFGGVARVHFGKGGCAEVPSDPRIRSVAPTIAGRRRKTPKHQRHCRQEPLGSQSFSFLRIHFCQLDPGARARRRGVTPPKQSPEPGQTSKSSSARVLPASEKPTLLSAALASVRAAILPVLSPAERSPLSGRRP